MRSLLADAASRVARRLAAPRIAVAPLRCSDLAGAERECRRCVEACPVDAIRFEQGTIRIDLECTECGVCHAACPSGVFRPRRVPDEGIVAACEKSLRGGGEGGEGILELACPSAPARGAVRLPCLARWTETILLEVVARGAGAVVLRRGACGGCPFEGAMAGFERSLERGRALLRAAGRGGVRVEVREVREGEGEGEGAHGMVPEGRTATRREIFQRIAAPLAGAGRPGARTGGSEGVRADPKRRGLLRALGRARAAAPAAPAGPAGLFALVSIDPGACDACGVCGALCPSGALRSSTAADSFRIDFAPAGCTACGVCARGCVRGAVRLEEPRTLEPLLSGAVTPLVEIPLDECPSCGARLVLGSAGLCEGCRARGGMAPNGGRLE